MGKWIEYLVVVSSVMAFLSIASVLKKEPATQLDPLIAQSTYMGPKERLKSEQQLVRVEVSVRDSPIPSGLEIESVSFDDINIPLKPRDVLGNRGGASFQKSPGVYKLKWVVNRDRLIWPRSIIHEEIVTLSPRDMWIQVSIEGEKASIH